MAGNSNLPATVPTLGGEASLNRYLSEIRKFPLLTPEEEYMLAKRFSEHGDPEAAARLVTSEQNPLPRQPSISPSSVAPA